MLAAHFPPGVTTAVALGERAAATGAAATGSGANGSAIWGVGGEVAAATGAAGGFGATTAGPAGSSARLGAPPRPQRNQQITMVARLEAAIVRTVRARGTLMV